MDSSRLYDAEVSLLVASGVDPLAAQDAAGRIYFPMEEDDSAD